MSVTLELTVHVHVVYSLLISLLPTTGSRATAVQVNKVHNFVHETYICTVFTHKCNQFLIYIGGMSKVGFLGQFLKN